MDYNKFLLETGAGSPVTVKYPRAKLFGIALGYIRFKAVLTNHVIQTRHCIVVNTDKDSINYLQPTTVDWRHIDQ